MRKETKEILKNILANTELIMTHLKLNPVAVKEDKKEIRTEIKKPSIRKLISKSKLKR